MSQAVPQSGGERLILDCLPQGATAELGTLALAERVVRGSFLRALLINAAGTAAASAGIRVSGGQLRGVLDLENIGPPELLAPALTLREMGGAEAEGLELLLRGALLGGLDLSGSTILRLAGEGMRSGRGVSLAGARLAGSPGVLELRGLGCDGALDLSGFGPLADGAVAPRVNLANAAIQGQVLLAGARLSQLNISGARIGGDVLLKDTRIIATPDAAAAEAERDRGLALRGNGCRLAGDLRLDGGSQLSGGMRLHEARIDGKLTLDEQCSILPAPKGLAIDLQSATVLGGLFIWNSEVTGWIGLLSADLGATLSLTACTLRAGKGGFALSAGGMAAGEVILDRVTATGTLSLRNAQVRLELRASGSFAAGLTEQGEVTPALDCGGIRVAGDFKLLDPEGSGPHAPRPTTLNGELTLDAAEIGRSLVIQVKGVLQGHAAGHGTLLSAPRAVIDGDVDLDGIEAHGSLNFHSARIGGYFGLQDGASIHAPGRQADGRPMEGWQALLLETARVGGTVFIGRAYGAAVEVQGIIRLFGAEITGGLLLERTARLGDGLFSVDAALARVGNSVVVSAATLQGCLRLDGATVAQDVEIKPGSQLGSRGDHALTCTGLRIQGEFHARGVAVPEDLPQEVQVQLLAPHAARDLLEQFGRNPSGELLRQVRASARTVIDAGIDAQDMRVERNVTFRDMRVRTRGLTVAMDFNGCSIGGQVAISGVNVAGTISMLNAAVTGAVQIDDGTDVISSYSLRQVGDMVLLSFRPAINLYGSRIGGTLWLDDARIHGQVALDSVTIGSELKLDGATLEEPPYEDASEVVHAMLAEARQGGGPPALPDQAPPRVVVARQPVALTALGLAVKQNVALGVADGRGRPAKIDGEVRMQRATIGGELVLTGLEIRPLPRLPGTAYEEDADVILSLEQARIGSALKVRGLPAETGGIIDLRGCHAAVLDDDGGMGWGDPKAHPGQVSPACNRQGERTAGVQLRLEGFTFDRLPDLDESGGTEAAKRRRLAYLMRQFPGARPRRHHYAPQPFEQVSKALRAIGSPEEAEYFARQKRSFRRRCGVDNWFGRRWLDFTGFFFGHFYSMRRAMFLAVLPLVLLGSLGLLAANAAGALRDSRNERACWQQPALAPSATAAGWLRPLAPGLAELPVRPSRVALEAMLMALHTAVPVVELKSAEYCQLDAAQPEYRFWIVLQTLYAGLGLLIVPLVVATATGVLKRD